LEGEMTQKNVCTYEYMNKEKKEAHTHFLEDKFNPNSRNIQLFSVI
jgi:hypothetical protein